jgi:hypothetical protein
MPDLSFNFINTMKKNIFTKVLSLLTVFAMTFNVVLAQVVEVVDEPQEFVCEQSNLILNGGFESPDVTNESGWELFSSGTDWDVSWLSPTEDAPINANLELHGGVNGWLPSEGVQYAELDADYGSPAGGSASVKISQEIQTVLGFEYTISYDFSPRPNTSADENKIVVKVDGSEVDSQGPVVGSGVNEWENYTAYFLGTGGVTVISFEDAGNSNSEGTFLDNVSVRCSREIPPPPPVCEPIELISENGRNGMVKVTKVNPRWVPSIAGTNAKWVWNNSSIPVFPDRQDGGVFTVNESVTIVGNPEESVIKIAADNVYSVVVNGNTVYAYNDNTTLTPGDIENIPSTDSKFSVVHEHTIPANYLNNGLNTIEIRAVNQKWPAVLSSDDTATNPAGLMYALTINEDCDDTVGDGDNGDGEPTDGDEGDNEDDQTGPIDDGGTGPGDNGGEPTNTDPQENSQGRSSSSGSRVSGGGAVLGASTGEVLGACVPFSMYHKKGDVGGEVAKIQEFLNDHMNAGLTVDGVYGETTVKAVHAFQQKYFEQVISPWVPSFMARTTGKWYKTTRMMANKIIDCPEAPVYLEDPKIIYEVKWEKPTAN